MSWMVHPRTFSAAYSDYRLYKHQVFTMSTGSIPCRFCSMLSWEIYNFFVQLVLFHFLSRISMLKHDIDIAILSICLYVHLSIHPCVGHVMRNTLAPFSRATSSSLIVCLYLAYSKLKINGVVECGCCMKKSRFSTTVWSIAAGNNVPSTLGQCIYDMYASDWVDQPCVIHKCHIAAHQWRSRLSQILLQKYSQCNIFLLIINSSGATAL